MKIGFDAKKIVRNLTGIGNYSRMIVQALSDFYPDNDYLLFSPSRKDSPAKARLKAAPNISYVYPDSPLPLIGEEYWRVAGVVSDIRRCGVDIFHGLSNELPFGIRSAGCKSVVTIHDLIFLRLPHTYSRSAREILRMKTKYACRNADAIIAISERTKADIIEYYGISPEKIHLVYQGCDPIFSKPVDKEEIDKVKNLYGIQGRYLLSVGTIQERKNQIACVRVLPRIPADVRLVLVGKGDEYMNKVKAEAEKLGVAGRVSFLSGVPHPHLPAIIKGCEVFLYMSRYEGFGIPILEAMTCGVPVIAASGSCLEEVGGDAALYSNPDDYDSLAANILSVLSDHMKAATMVDAAKDRITLFSPQAIASSIMDVYRSVLAQ